jgi:hypothetical protein
MYPTRELAEDALIEARTAYDYGKGRGPVTVYLCDECGHYHLTSQGPMNEKLAAHLSDGKINLQKEANKWMDRIKRKR